MTPGDIGLCKSYSEANLCLVILYLFRYAWINSIEATLMAVLGGRIADLQFCSQEVKLITTTKHTDSFQGYFIIGKNQSIKNKTK